MKLTTELPSTIHDMLNSHAFQVFESSKLGNDLFINDPDRASRIHDAAEHGCDGSTHAEHIDDWREFAEQLREQAMHEAYAFDECAESDALEAGVDAWHDKLTQEIDACEAWHEANGSLHEEIG